MTDKKILTPAEALRALADGRKLTCEDWLPNQFIHLVGTSLFEEDGRAYSFGDRPSYFGHFYEYTEPTPKVVWVEYLCVPSVGGRHAHPEWHRDIPIDLDKWSYHPTGRKMEV